jgi:hypothetical protein
MGASRFLAFDHGYPAGHSERIGTEQVDEHLFNFLHCFLLFMYTVNWVDKPLYSQIEFFQKPPVLMTGQGYSGERFSRRKFWRA